MNRTRKNDINKYILMAGMFTIGEKNALVMQRGNAGLVVRACWLCARRGALVTPVQVQVGSVSRERVERSMNELSNVYNPFPFSFI